MNRSRVREMSYAEIVERACRASPAIWAREKHGYVNAPFHDEWYRIRSQEQRAAINAPREHAKTEVVTVNSTAHESIYMPGTWTYVFAATGDLAKGLKARIDAAIEHVHPEMVSGAIVKNDKETEYANGSRITVAGAGKAVRSAHPDVIIGDDVLEESTCLTAYQREKTMRWWFGTVSNMAHPQTTRVCAGVRRSFPPTRIYLVGTPFHEKDLLLQMLENPLYRYYRYAAEFDPADLVAEGSLAVEMG